MSAFAAETIELASGRSQVVHRGGDGPPLLWLHSLFGFDASDPLVAALAEHHAVVAPVAPGFEDVGELVGIEDVHDLALHYDDVLEALGLGSVPVAGHSFGAMIGAELAAHRPDRVSRLVLVSPLGLWDDEHPVEDLFATPYPDMPTLLYADAPTKDGAVPTVGVEGDVERLVTLAQAMTTVAKFLWPIPDRGLRRRLYRIAAPTLVVFGERDGLVPARYADDFVAGLPDGRSEIVGGGGHMVHVERPEEVASAVTGFLAGARSA